MSDQEQRLSHLFVVARVEDREFTRRGGGDARVREVERRAHGQRLQAAAASSLEEQARQREQFGLDELEALGVVITIEGSEGVDYPLRLESLERLSSHRAGPLPKWLLLSVSPASDEHPERAVVWVSDSYRDAFLKLFEDYLERDSRGGNPLNRELVANMTRIRTTVLRDLWQSEGEPDIAGLTWWELWLRPEPDAVELARRFAETRDLKLNDRHMAFDTRTVIWVQARWEDLLALPFTSVPIAEIRRPQFVDTVEDLAQADQDLLAEDLGSRILPAREQAPAVCLIDTGVRRTHVLLEGSLSETDMHSVVGASTGDIWGHGTLMAGLALLGRVSEELLGNRDVTLRHRLESVKLLPDPDSPPHDPEAYGIVTAEAVAAPEAAASRSRAYCLPVTAEADRPGEPSLWSATIDALAAGTDVGRSADGIELLGPPSRDAARLIVISIGNVYVPDELEYQDKCDLTPTADPGQAWNALTVGGYTELTELPSDPTYDGWAPVAAGGDISPHSRTGVLAGGKAWPIKPDLCMESGNVLTDTAGDFHMHHPVVSLLTTDRRNDVALGSANGTSASAAQVCRLAALTMATYPSYWPETVRGLLTHNAEWTDFMRSVITAETGKTQRLTLLKRYGWGVPSEKDVLTSVTHAVTMVVQDEYIPFSGEEYRMRNFRLHQLPWPREVLEALGADDVELRVTLSYFIEPSAARRGWRRRYAYASHGLRFELRGPHEDTPTFIRRVNRDAAREEDGSGTSGSSTDQWMIGPNQRNKGSLHQDVWKGHGAQLAASGGVLAVHAIGGWWKNNRRRDRVELPVRYALIASLRTKATEVDLYTPIAIELEVPVTGIEIEI